MSSAIASIRGPFHFRAGSLSRLLVSLALLGAGVGLLLVQPQIRAMESLIASWVAINVLDMTIVHQAGTAVMYLTLPEQGATTSWIGLEITPECTVALLIAPLIILSAGLVLGRRLSIRALLIATLVTAVLFVVVNLIRLLVIAGATHLWGLSAFRWTHEIYGSLISIVGVCLGIVVFLKLLNRLTTQIADPDGA